LVQIKCEEKGKQVKNSNNLKSSIAQKFSHFFRFSLNSNISTSAFYHIFDLKDSRERRKNKNHHLNFLWKMENLLNTRKSFMKSLNEIETV